MTSSEDAIGKRGSHVLTAIGLLLLLGMPFLYELTSKEALSADPYVYNQTAKEMLGGKRLYLDTWQDKPPLAFIFYAVPQIVAPRSYSASMVWFAICLDVQALMFWWVFRSTPLAAFCCLAFTVLYPMTEAEYCWPATEHFSNLFVAGNLLLAFLFFRDRKFSLAQCASAGVLTCLAFHVRQTTLFCGLVPLLGIALADQSKKEKIRGVLVMAGAALVCFGAMLGLVAVIGDLKGYYYTVFVYPGLYSHYGDLTAIPDLLVRLFLHSVPLVAAIFVGLCMGRKYQWLAIAAIVIGFFCCMLPQRAFAHYWANLLPFVALLMGLAMQDAVENARRVTLAVLAWLGAFSALFIPMRIIAANINSSQLRYERVAAATDKIAPANATLLVIGRLPCQAIQFASRLPAANTFSADFQFLPPWCDMLPRKLDTIFGEYLSNPPGVIDIDKAVLPRILANPEPKDLENNLMLARLLLAKYRYHPIAEQDEFEICVR